MWGFESTEARHRQAHVKRIRPHNFCTGDSVLFRNPANHGLASTIGIVGEKVVRNLYKVIHDNQSIVLAMNIYHLHVKTGRAYTLSMH